MVQLSKDGEKAAAAADAAATRLAAKSEPAGHKKQTREERRALVQNPWQPNYEALHLNDLFTLTGELTERMTDTMAHVVHLIKASTQLLCQQLAVHWHICVSWQPLAARACPCAHTQSFETQFLEIFNYYASLGQVRIIDDKLTLVRAQFNKLARATGIASSPSHPLLTEQAEDCFMAVADRVTNYYADYSHREHFITFPEFPEVVCRLAAVKYDWRPPDCPDDGEDDIAQPEALRAVPLANIYELPTANHYGVGPTAKPGTAAAQDSGQPLSPRTEAEMQKRNRSDMDGEDLALSQVVSQLGPQPPDVVLYCIVKVGGGEVMLLYINSQCQSASSRTLADIDQTGLQNYASRAVHKCLPA
jgi:hypothetical protein